MDADALKIEGLAAQLYVIDRLGAPFGWWHVLREEIKERYRGIAAQKISDYHRDNDIPELSDVALADIRKCAAEDPR